MPNALSVYGKTKYRIEKYCMKNDIIIIRPGLIFGKDIDKKLIIMSKIIKFLPFLIYFHHPRKYIHFVNINELCEAIHKIILNKYKSQIFNIFSKKKFYFYDILNLLSNKYKIKISYFFFKVFFISISKLIYLKSIDSLLGIMQNRNDQKKIFEKNIFTKKNLFKKKQ